MAHDCLKTNKKEWNCLQWDMIAPKAYGNIIVCQVCGRKFRECNPKDWLYKEEKL